MLPENRGGPSYTDAVDLWALGCMVYGMLASQMPFVAPTTLLDVETSGLAPQIDQLHQVDPTQLYRYCSGDVPFPIEELIRAGADDHAIAFVAKLLRADPLSRLSAPAALQTPWLLQNPVEGDTSLDDPNNNPNRY